MCGIAGVYVMEGAAQDRWSRLRRKRVLEDLLIQIKERGTDATGVAIIQEDGEYSIYKEAVDSRSFILSEDWNRWIWRENVRIVMAHTRKATRGSPEDPRNNHPLRRHSIILTHNGGVHNELYLRQKFQMPRVSQVDSEAFAYLLEMGTGPAGFTNKRLHKALREFDGDAAFAAVDLDFYDTLLLGRTSTRPLAIAVSPQRRELWWASKAEYLQYALRRFDGFSVFEFPVDSFRIIRGDAVLWMFNDTAHYRAWARRRWTTPKPRAKGESPFLLTNYDGYWWRR